MKLARIFPTKTNMTPVDLHAYSDVPDLFTPQYDEAHISVTFTWDVKKAKELEHGWRNHAKVIKIGGVAIDGESDQPFQAGMYLREGVTITSRGCPMSCSFCLVRKDLIEFDEFPAGNIVNDNNFLACSDRHKQLVYKMLRKQKGIEFKGGIQASRVTAKVAEELRSLSIKTLWLACDTDASLKQLKTATKLLQKAGFKRDHLHCYVLVGREEQRLKEVYDIGCLPFAQLYLPPLDHKLEYSAEARRWQRLWCRPALYRHILKERTEKLPTFSSTKKGVNHGRCREGSKEERNIGE